MIGYVVMVKVKPMNDAREIWLLALLEIEANVSWANFLTWFKDTQGLEYDDTHFIVGVPNACVAEYLKINWRPPIENTLERILHRSMKVHFQIGSPRSGEVNGRDEEISLITIDEPGSKSLSTLTELEKLRGCLMELVRIPTLMSFVSLNLPG